MKQSFFKRVLYLTAFTLLLLCSLFVPIHAMEEEQINTETVPSEFSELLELLPTLVSDLLPDGIFSEQTEEVHGAVLEMSDFSYLLKTLLSTVGFRGEKCLRLLATIVGILILSSLCRVLQTAIKSASVSRAFSLCSTCVMLVLLLREGYEGISAVTEYFTSLSTMTASAIPLLGGLYAMGGNVSAAVASSAGLGVFLAVLDGLVAKTILPFCGICLSFTLVGALDPGMRTGTLLSTVKKNYTTLLTFLMMLLLTMLSSQTLLSARADTLAMKSAKFAAGNLIPVLGGSISELLRTVGVGVSYLRGTLGICATLLLLLLLLPPVIELLLLRLTWQLCASVADMLGCDTEKRLLEEFSSVGGYLIAAMCICSSVLLLAFTLLTHCASAVG